MPAHTLLMAIIDGLAANARHVYRHIYTTLPEVKTSATVVCRSIIQSLNYNITASNKMLVL